MALHAGQRGGPGTATHSRRVEGTRLGGIYARWLQRACDWAADDSASSQATWRRRVNFPSVAQEKALEPLHGLMLCLTGRD